MELAAIVEKLVAEQQYSSCHIISIDFAGSYSREEGYSFRLSIMVNIPAHKNADGILWDRPATNAELIQKTIHGTKKERKAYLIWGWDE